LVENILLYLHENNKQGDVTSLLTYRQKTGGFNDLLLVSSTFYPEKNLTFPEIRQTTQEPEAGECRNSPFWIAIIIIFE
jgi:hypothetical protein